jgi:hypothetical protein
MPAFGASRRIPLSLKPSDVLPTSNEWIALPDTAIPQGSLMKLPAFGFISATDPAFGRTYRWLYSGSYKYSYADQPFGLPGSYRLQFTTSWSIADHLPLAMGREQALKVLHASGWDREDSYSDRMKKFH